MNKYLLLSLLGLTFGVDAMDSGIGIGPSSAASSSAPSEELSAWVDLASRPTQASAASSSSSFYSTPSELSRKLSRLMREKDSEDGFKKLEDFFVYNPVMVNALYPQTERGSGLPTTPLVNALLNEKRRLIDLLLAFKNIDVNYATESETPLVCAIRMGNSSAAKKMVELGADVNTPAPADQGYATPLHMAVICGDEDMAKYLLARPGINTNLDFKNLLYFESRFIEYLQKYPTNSNQKASPKAEDSNGDSNMGRVLFFGSKN